ncbi:MAG: hypothetical protein ABJC39_04875 [Chloroflexota bacterium]
MRRTITLAAAVGLLLISAMPVFAASGDAGVVMVMKHACSESPIKSEADFKAVEAKAKGDAVLSLALTVLACPAIVLPADAASQTDGVHGTAVDFAFSVTDSSGDVQTLSDAKFVPMKLCETDIDRDANGDGAKTADVCLDVSHYEFSNLAVGKVTVKETTPPNGWRFGTLRLTPKALQPTGNDQATGARFNAGRSTVTLDLAGDSDNTAMLHIYNFENSPATDTVPAVDGISDAAMLPIAAGIAVTLMGLALVRRRRTAA